MARDLDSGLAGLRQALRALRRMMGGEEVTVADFAEEGIGKAPAVRRRLQALARELPNVVSSGRKGQTARFRWTWPSTEQTQVEQVWALAAARTILDTFREGEIGRILTNLLEEHIRRLPRGQLVRDDLDRMFYAATRLVNPHDVSIDNIDRIATAIAEHLPIDTTYVQFDGTLQNETIEPWTLLFADEGPYLYGRCTASTKERHIDTRRIYNIARFTELRLKKEPFVYPLRADYDPTDAFGHCFTVMLPAEGSGGPSEVVLLFEPAMRQYFQNHHIHATQRPPSFDAEGRVRIELHLHVTYDLVRWIRGHGKTVSVLAPEPLRRWVESGRGGDAYKEFVMAVQSNGISASDS